MSPSRRDPLHGFAVSFDPYRADHPRQAYPEPPDPRGSRYGMGRPETVPPASCRRKRKKRSALDRFLYGDRKRVRRSLRTIWIVLYAACALIMVTIICVTLLRQKEAVSSPAA